MQDLIEKTVAMKTKTQQQLIKEKTEYTLKSLAFDPKDGFKRKAGKQLANQHTPSYTCFKKPNGDAIPAGERPNEMAKSLAEVQRKKVLRSRHCQHKIDKIIQDHADIEIGLFMGVKLSSTLQNLKAKKNLSQTT